MRKKKKILIICFTSPVRDLRFKREIDFLKDEFDVTVAGAAPAYPGLSFEEIKCRPQTWLNHFSFKLGLLFGSFTPLIRRYSVSRDFLKKTDFDLVICNDLLPLPLAFKIAKGAPVFWDAHEYYPEELASGSLGQKCSNRSAYRLCKKLLPDVNAMSSVCPAICARYRNEFSLSEEPLLIRNIPYYQDLIPSQTFPDKIRMIHHGGINQDRKIEVMIDFMDLLDSRFTLDLMLMHNESNREYYDFIVKKASHNPKIRVLQPVSQSCLVKKTNEYDLGLFLMPPTNYNTEKALPNKIFEYIQARLAVAIGPSPEMAAIVKQYDVGVVSEDFSPESLAAALKKLSFEDIVRFKQNSDLAAHELCAEKEMPKLVEKIKELLA